jgi:hypothetical protein
MRVASVRAARRKLVKLFREPNSEFYWYEFTVRSRRYRRSTQETKLARAAKAASVKLGSVIEGTEPFPGKPSVLSEFAERFDTWVEDGRLEEKTKKFHRNGWRLLKATPVAGLRVDQITGDFAEQLKFPGSAANAKCALRTLRRMLHKAEEWKVIGHAPKIKMMKEHGRHLRLDDEAERKLTMGGLACNWRPRTRDLFRDIVILMRDTGMRGERELFRMCIENLDWQNRVIFVPDSTTAEGATTGSDERASLRNSADQVRCKTGGLGISIEALRIWASEVNLQSLPKSAQQSRSSERTGSLLCAT